MDVVNCLRRLGFIDKPSVGDHFHLWKVLVDHPDGPVTIRTGLDTQKWYEGDLKRIRKETHLDGDLWRRALDKTLTRTEYDAHLKKKRKWELVIPFYAEKVKKEVLEAEGQTPAKEAKPARKRRPRQPGRRTK